MLCRPTGVVSRALKAAGLAFVIGVILLSPSSAATSAVTSGISMIYFGSSSWSGSTSNLPKYGNVVLSVDKYALLPGIRSASPTTRVTGYKTATEMSDNCGSMIETCSSAITYQQALAHDSAYPNDPWILKSAAGSSIVAPAYNTYHLANVGSASYQKQWLANVTGVIKKFGFDGVYIDSILGQIGNWSGGVMPTLYPTEADWENAMRGFMAAVGPQLKAQGYYVLANAFKSGPNDGSAHIAWWRSIAPYVSGLQSEYFEQASSAKVLYDTNPCCWTGNYLSQLGLAAAAQDAGADFYAGMKGSAGETGKMMYGKASFLLVWDGSGGGFFWQSNDYSDPWNPAWTTDIGTPTAARYQVGVGLRRQYTGGTALVNPHYATAQTFNLGGSYITPSGATVSSVTLNPTTAMILRTTQTASSASAPVNTSLPTISGSAMVGQSLSAGVGSWSGSPTSYGFQWRRCDTGGNACVTVAGVTASSYLLGSGDRGYTIRVNVFATNAAGTGSVNSNPSGVVVAATTASTAPVNTSLPTISGSAMVGQSLSAGVGSWSGSPTSYGFQWRRCDTGGNACVTVAGVTASSYLLGSADRGYTIRVNVFATNAAGTGSVNSNPSGVVVAATTASTAPVNTSLPTISGSAMVGQRLTAGVGSWSGSPTSYAFQWRRCDTGGNACNSVAGATANTYLLGNGDVGYTIRVNVFATNAAGTAWMNSNPTAAVKAATASTAPVNTSLPTISGSAMVGQRLTAGVGSWSGSPTSYAFQWRRCDTGGNACNSVAGATANTYLLGNGDVGYTIRVNVFATNAAGTAWMNSNPTAAVKAATASTAPVNTSLPTISGSAMVGQRLTAGVGSWSGSPTSYAFQWRRCDTGGNACNSVAGATANTYLLGNGDVGYTIRVNVFATNAAGTAWMNSNATGVVLR